VTKEKGIKILAGLSILIYILFIIIGKTIGIKEFIPECIIFIGLTIIYYILYEKFKMTPLIFLFLQIGHITHALGTFGYYHTSPIPIRWERITHTFGAMPFAFLFFNYFKNKWNHKIFTRKNITRLLIVFFAATGVGGLVEASEFWGFQIWGEGEGVFMFGPGDGFITAEGIEILDAHGGGWINMGWDVTVNTIAVIFGMIIMSILQWMPRNKKEIKLYELEEKILSGKKKYSRKI
jgi:hypothetical protein